MENRVDDLVHLGCRTYQILVIAGAAQGQVWTDDRSSDGGINPETGFRSWYLSWLRGRP